MNPFSSKSENIPREGHPLKEGLRPRWNESLWNREPKAQRGSSTKRGIKTTIPPALYNLLIIPREGHPLKEGLRRFLFLFLETAVKTQRGSSTKRGIKTSRMLNSRPKLKTPREGHPLKEGLRLVCLSGKESFAKIPERVIH